MLCTTLCSAYVVVGWYLQMGIWAISMMRAPNGHLVYHGCSIHSTLRVLHDVVRRSIIPIPVEERVLWYYRSALRTAVRNEYVVVGWYLQMGIWAISMMRAPNGHPVDHYVLHNNTLHALHVVVHSTYIPIPVEERVL